MKGHPHLRNNGSTLVMPTELKYEYTSPIDAVNLNPFLLAQIKRDNYETTSKQLSVAAKCIARQC